MLGLGQHLGHLHANTVIQVSGHLSWGQPPLVLAKYVRQALFRLLRGLLCVYYALLGPIRPWLGKPLSTVVSIVMAARGQMCKGLLRYPNVLNVFLELGQLMEHQPALVATPVLFRPILGQAVDLLASIVLQVHGQDLAHLPLLIATLAAGARF